MTEKLLDLSGVKKTYYTDEIETPVLHGISFYINKGEFVAIMGPSGSGKSTLLHILGFLDRQTGGTYSFDGKTIEDLTDDQVAGVRNSKMGFVFQSFNLLPRHTVLENVKLPLMYSSVPESEWEKRAMDAIKLVQLDHRANFETTKLSGGEKQRVAIARALVNKPTIIFADEPTGNLDSDSGRIIMDTLQELNEVHGHTVILVTHETYTADYASRIIRLRDGRVETDSKVSRRHKRGDKFIK
ncbi:MAG: ABC transporter ATP-binding protein [bacterium]|nr:ABC transporter ATP-binding protein [bacterium]